MATSYLVHSINSKQNWFKKVYTLFTVSNYGKRIELTLIQKPLKAAM